MNALITLADLNITINHEPRIRDLTIAERLGMIDLHSIRRMIETNRAELESYGVISDQQSEITGAGRPGTEYWLNEAQALLLCTFSRTAQAAAVRKALIDVYMAYRHKPITVRAYRRKLPERRAAIMLAPPVPSERYLNGNELFALYNALVAAAAQPNGFFPNIFTQAVCAHVGTTDLTRIPAAKFKDAYSFLASLRAPDDASPHTPTSPTTSRGAAHQGGYDHE